MSLAVTPSTTLKQPIFVYALGAGPGPEFRHWLEHFAWQTSARLNDVSQWLMSQTQPNLLVDLRVSPQRMLAEIKYLVERFNEANIIALIRPEHMHWGQEAVRLGAAFYISPEHCTAEGVAMLLDGKQLTTQRAPGAKPQLDPLTGLVNRTLCCDRLDHALRLARRRDSLTGLLLVDIDRFQEINEQHGQWVGDQVLQWLAVKITELMRTCDTLARTDTNEFALIIEDLQDETMLGHIASKIHQLLSEPLNIDGQSIVVTLGIGGQLAHAGELNAEALMRQAATALKRAKESGRKGLWFFSQSLNIKTTARNHMEEGLQKALQREEFMLQFQPVHLASNGQLCGADVILRWRHPTAGLVPAEVFQPLLQSSGLIDDVDRWVFTQACRSMAQWRTQQDWPDTANLMLPLCLKQIRNLAYAQFIHDTLDMFGLDGHSVVFEVSEDIPMQHKAALQAFLDELPDVGIAVRVTSLADRQMALTFLKHLNIKLLKIGQASIRNMDVDHIDAAVTRVVMEIAHIYGVEVLAQDVDSRYQIEKLRALGCDRFQGYVYSKPVEGEEWQHYLKTRSHQHTIKDNS